MRAKLTVSMPHFSKILFLLIENLSILDGGIGFGLRMIVEQSLGCRLPHSQVHFLPSSQLVVNMHIKYIMRFDGFMSEDIFGFKCKDNFHCHFRESGRCAIIYTHSVIP